MKSWSPRREVPGECGNRRNVNEALCGQTPIGETCIGEADANNTGDGDGGHLHDTCLLDLQMSEKPCALGCAQAREDETEEGKTSEGAEDGLIVEIGNQWGGKEEDDVEYNAHDDVEPEDGIVFFVRRLALVG